MFKRDKQEAALTNNGQSNDKRSRWQGIIDNLTLAHRALSETQNQLSIMGFELQKPADFIAFYRDNLIKAVEDSGGVVEQGSVEQQIREFIPKNYRPPERAGDENP